MAYPSKAERMATFQDYLHRQWVRSLRDRPTSELVALMAAVQERLEHTPKRHVHRIQNIQHKIAVLRCEIEKRTN
jgi:hypothetical protein